LTTTESTGDHAILMDRIYRNQRYIYDFTRKYYLLGRDRLIAELALKPGDSLVEIGSGTARNLIRIARKYPGVELYGLDASTEMLKSARRAVEQAGLCGRIHLGLGLAEELRPDVFGRTQPFDHAVFSYSLSMISDWKQALNVAFQSVGAEGRVHIVDFGDLTGLGRIGRAVLTRWLQLFRVSPRVAILQSLESLSHSDGAQSAEFSMLPARYAFIWSGNGALIDKLAP
jgi:S-adenosylmethionine-diacylgycerolhomoserine-N-methlytransferase